MVARVYKREIKMQSIWSQRLAHRVCPVPASIRISMSEQCGSYRGSDLARNAEACRDEDILDTKVANSGGRNLER